MYGLNISESEFSVPDTVNRALTAIEKVGGSVFTQIDHSEEAEIKGLDLRPTALILFGNPEVGTKLMQDRQTSAIDLPLKLLILEDQKGQTHIGYNNMDWLKKRHELTDDETINKIETVLEEICTAASKNHKLQSLNYERSYKIFFCQPIGTLIKKSEDPYLVVDFAYTVKCLNMPNGYGGR